MIDFKVVECPDLKDITAPRKYRASIAQTKEVELDKVAQMISKQCTLNSVDVSAVLQSLTEVVPELLSLGLLVKMGKLGSFQLTLGSQIADNASNITAESIKNARIRFRPGIAMKKNLGTLTFRKIE